MQLNTLTTCERTENDHTWGLFLSPSPHWRSFPWEWFMSDCALSHSFFCTSSMTLITITSTALDQTIRAVHTRGTELGATKFTFIFCPCLSNLLLRSSYTNSPRRNKRNKDWVLVILRLYDMRMCNFVKGVLTLGWRTWLNSYELINCLLLPPFSFCRGAFTCHIFF